MRTLTPDGLIDLLLKSGLVGLEHLDGYPVPTADDPATAARDLAAKLVRDRWVTLFQAKHLLAGRYRGFFFGGKYKVLAHLGSGGMGHVYLCEHLLLQRLVAVKRLALGGGGGAKEAAERFLREARAVAAVDHPNVVRVFDMDKDKDDPFMVMEYVDGTSLHDLVTTHGPLPPDRAADCGRQAALGLQHALDLGLIHRDVKPGNLLLDRAGGVKVLDLGLARFVIDEGRNANLTARFDDQTVVGTADYIAPEQAAESKLADHRSDQYALGGTLYFLLTGRPPFPEGTLSQKLVWHQLKQPLPVRDRRPDVPTELAAVVERMMSKDPAARYSSHADAAEALAGFAAAPSRPPSAHMPKVPPTAYRLGFSPGPPPRTPGGPDSGRLALTPSPGRAEMDTSPGGSVRPRPPGPVSPPPAPRSDPLPAVPKARRRWPMMIAAAAALSVVAIAGAVAGGLFDGRPAGPTTFAPPPVTAELTAAGSTFVQPLMEVWSVESVRATGVKVRYGGGGSGRGVKGMLDRELHFGCTDATLTDDELAAAKAAGGPVLHVPLAMGAVVPTYNLPDVPGRLRFTGPLLADIFLGRVTKWNDPGLRSNNPGVSLPDLPITVVHRSDKSGTTFIWADYLTRKSGVWKARMGAKAEFPTWPTGVGGKGNDGVAEKVSQTLGAVGYLELSFALKNSLPAGAVQNKAGRYVEPSLQSVSAAAAAELTSIPTDLRYTLVDAGGEDSYPVAGTAWAVLYAAPPGGHPPGLVDFLWWATHDGQAALPKMQYAPLPPELVALVETKLRPLRK